MNSERFILEAAFPNYSNVSSKQTYIQKPSKHVEKQVVSSIYTTCPRELLWAHVMCQQRKGQNEDAGKWNGRVIF